MAFIQFSERKGRPSGGSMGFMVRGERIRGKRYQGISREDRLEFIGRQRDFRRCRRLHFLQP